MNQIKRLQSVAADPEAQAALAISLLDKRTQHDVLLAALAVLARCPAEDARAPILALYEHLARDGVKRDAGAFVRAAAINALRPVATQDDVPLLLEAVQTYEFLPPNFSEEAAALRAAAILCLNALDTETTGYHAARLLVDRHQAQMSGEPGTTAARVLASRGEYLLLYTTLIGAGGKLPEETVAEILRSLTAVPASLVPGIVAMVAERANAVEMVGLVDLLLTHEEGPLGMEFLSAYLAEPPDLDVYRYLVIAALMTRREALVEAVCAAAGAARLDPQRGVLLEALEPFVDIPCVGEAVRLLEEDIDGLF